MRYVLAAVMFFGGAVGVSVAKDAPRPLSSSADSVTPNEMELSGQADAQAATVEALSQMVQAAMQRELEVRVQLNAEIASMRALKGELQETKEALRQERAKPTPKCSP